MFSTSLYVKGIIHKDNKYLVVKHWVDDHLPDPFVWEFMDGEVSYGEAPDDAVLRLIRERLGVEGVIDRILYTWSMMIGDTHCVGISYLCSAEADETQYIITEEYGDIEWIDRSQFDEYIGNSYVIEDLKGVEL